MSSIQFSIWISVINFLFNILGVGKLSRFQTDSEDVDDNDKNRLLSPHQGPKNNLFGSQVAK
jgi:hypothetical protein